MLNLQNPMHMKTLYIFFVIIAGTFAIAQEPVFLRDFASGGADTFTFDPEIKGITVNNHF